MLAAPVPKHDLSKSTFMYGCQCPKRLWLHKFNPGARDEEDEAQTAIFQRGTDVGLVAQQLFPGGIDARPADAYSYQQSVADTERYIRQGHTIIYEAAFQVDGILCAVDILVKEHNKWVAYEVKSSTKVKEPFIQDTALQYYVITGAGIALEDICVVVLNNHYVRYGKLDIGQLFSPISVLKQVLELQPFIAKKAKELKHLLTQENEPLVETGGHCNKPYTCDFIGYCTRQQVQQIPGYGAPFINKKAINEFLQGVQYPVYFMDFETWMTAIPEYDGHWCYRQVNFQFSVHMQPYANAPLQHHSYLADGPHSTQLEFIEKLVKVLGKKGTVLVYNKAFENTRLNELKADYPCYETAINAIQVRIVDLMQPFRKNYRLPAMQNSFSIKYVLPALAPGLSYAKLQISNGADASTAFYNLKNETDAEKIANVRNSLLEYCEMDTMAMVTILEKLRSV